MFYSLETEPRGQHTAVLTSLSAGLRTSPGGLLRSARRSARMPGCGPLPFEHILRVEVLSSFGHSALGAPQWCCGPRCWGPSWWRTRESCVSRETVPGVSSCRHRHGRVCVHLSLSARVHRTHVFGMVHPVTVQVFILGHSNAPSRTVSKGNGKNLKHKFI